MGVGLTTTVFKLAGAAVVVIALFFASYSIAADPQSFLWRLWARYIASLDRRLRLMFIFTKGERIAQGQVAASFGVIALHAMVDIPYWYMFVVLIAAGPSWYIDRMRQQRVEAIEAQIDAFLMALANALKATPSVADAFISVQTLIPPPLQQEIELATKEMRVGSSLDQALLHMAGRVGSRQFDSALSAVLIGRQLGGNLPVILDTTAATFREMARLEGFVRSKTAEGKAQLVVLAVFPFLLMYALHSVRPGYFDPLTESVAGYIVAVCASICWIGSIVVARKVLAVDI